MAPARRYPLVTCGAVLISFFTRFCIQRTLPHSPYAAGFQDLWRLYHVTTIEDRSCNLISRARH